MSGPNFNLTTQQAATKNPLIIDVYNAAQLPLTLAPDGVMRFKAALGTKYIIHPGVLLPRIEIPPFVDPAAVETIEFTAAVQAQFVPIMGSTIPHFWGRNINSLLLRSIGFVDTTPHTTKLFDLVGGTNLSAVILDLVNIFMFKEVGNVVDLTVVTTGGFFVDVERGLVSRNSGPGFLSSFTNGRITSFFATATKSAGLCFLGNQSTANVSINNFELGAADAIICVDSALIGNIDIISNSFDGVASFFEPPISNAITAFASADVAITSFSNSVANPGTHTDINFTNPTLLIRGQTILISGEAAYDGTHVVTGVSTNQLRVEIEVIHSTSGAGVLEQTKVTSTNHRLVRDQTNTISGTTSYDGTRKLLDIVDDNNFLIPAAFIADDATGTVAATSGDEKTPEITSVVNGQAPNSRTIGFGQMNGNATVTTVALSNTYQAMDVSTVTNNTVSQRFTLIDAVEGVYRYDGVKQITATIIGLVSGFKSGSTANYRFAISINGAIPAFGSVPYAPLEIKTTKTAITVLNAVILTPNDTIQIMVAGDSTSDNLTISDFNIEVRGDQ